MKATLANQKQQDAIQRLRNLANQEQQDAIQRLRKHYKLRPGSTVYTIVRHRSASGMYRVIDLYVIQKNTPYRITGLVCKATGTRWDDRHQGMSAPGCGLDVCFEAVYNLGRKLFPKGFKDKDTGEVRKDGGYALRKESL